MDISFIYIHGCMYVCMDMSGWMYGTMGLNGSATCMNTTEGVGLLVWMGMDVIYVYMHARVLGLEFSGSMWMYGSVIYTCYRCVH